MHRDDTSAGRESAIIILIAGYRTREGIGSVYLQLNTQESVAVVSLDARRDRSVGYFGVFIK